MIMIGCDFHPGLEELALLDTETDRRWQHCLSHSFGAGPMREFSANLPKPVRLFTYAGFVVCNTLPAIALR